MSSGSPFMSLTSSCFPINSITTTAAANFTTKPFPISRQRFQLNRAQLQSSHYPILRQNPPHRWIHEMELAVRISEVDQFGIVNNAVYGTYCQHQQHEFLKNCTSSYADAAARNDYLLALAEFSIKYIAPLKDGDRFLIKLKATGWSKTCLFLEQVIFRLPNQEVIMEGKATAVLIDKEARRMSFPPNLLTEISQLRL